MPLLFFISNSKIKFLEQLSEKLEFFNTVEVNDKHRVQIIFET